MYYIKSIGKMLLLMMEWTKLLNLLSSDQVTFIKVRKNFMYFPGNINNVNIHIGPSPGLRAWQMTWAGTKEHSS